MAAAAPRLTSPSPAPYCCATTGPTTTIAALPADVLRSIFAFIELDPLLRAVSLVCRHWRRQVLLTENFLSFSHWSHQCRREVTRTSIHGCLDRYHNACSVLSNITSLRLRPCMRGIVRIPPTVRHLRLQVTIRWGVSKETARLADALPALHSLELSEAGVGDIALRPLVASVVSLTSLSLEATAVSRAVVAFLTATHFPSLRRLACVQPSHLVQNTRWIDPFLRAHASQLTSLSYRWPNRNLSIETMHFPRLTHLVVDRTHESNFPSPEQCAAILRNSPKLATVEVIAQELSRVTTAVTILHMKQVRVPPDPTTLRRTFPRLECVNLKLWQSNAVDGAYVQALLDADVAARTASIRIESCGAEVLLSFLIAATRLRTLHISADIPGLAAALPSLRLPSLSVLHLAPAPATQDAFHAVLRIARAFVGAAPLNFLNLTLPYLPEDEVAELAAFVRELQRRCVSCHVTSPSYKAVLCAAEFLETHAWATLSAVHMWGTEANEREDRKLYGEGLGALWRITSSSWTLLAGQANAPFVATIKSTVGNTTVYSSAAAAAGYAPNGRSRHACAVDGEGRLWIYGGTGYGTFYGDVWSFDLATAAWTYWGGVGDTTAARIYTPTYTGPAPTPNIRDSQRWVWLRNKLWMFGGDNEECYADLWTFDTASPASGWTFVGGAQGNSCLSALGGSFPPGCSTPPCVCPAGSADTCFPPTRDLFAMWTNGDDALFVYGGYDWAAGLSADQAPWDDVWVYNITTQLWMWFAGSPNPGNMPDYTLHRPGGRSGGFFAYSLQRSLIYIACGVQGDRNRASDLWVAPLCLFGSLVPVCSPPTPPYPGSVCTSQGWIVPGTLQLPPGSTTPITGVLVVGGFVLPPSAVIEIVGGSGIIQSSGAVTLNGTVVVVINTDPGSDIAIPLVSAGTVNLGPQFALQVNKNFTGCRHVSGKASYSQGTLSALIDVGGCGSKRLATGAIIGIVVAGAVAIAVIVILLIVLAKCGRANRLFGTKQETGDIR